MLDVLVLNNKLIDTSCEVVLWLSNIPCSLVHINLGSYFNKLTPCVTGQPTLASRATTSIGTSTLQVQELFCPVWMGPKQLSPSLRSCFDDAALTFSGLTQGGISNTSADTFFVVCQTTTSPAVTAIILRWSSAILVVFLVATSNKIFPAWVLLNHGISTPNLWRSTPAMTRRITSPKVIPSFRLYNDDLSARDPSPQQTSFTCFLPVLWPMSAEAILQQAQASLPFKPQYST